MTDTATPFKPKKSVALSGVAAGNTALCTVGRSGNDLHYRGYDILDVATTCEFEEIAHLLVHGKLPNRAELAGYKAKLKALRGIPASVKAVLEQLPASAHPMDVMRTAVSALGCALPEKDDLVPFLVDHFAERIEHARSLGVEKIVIDPGMGFSFPNLDGVERANLQTRTITQNFRLRSLGVPTATVLPHNLDIFEDEFRKAEGFFTVFATFGGVHLLRVHEVPHIRTVLRAVDTLSVR